MISVFPSPGEPLFINFSIPNYFKHIRTIWNNFDKYYFVNLGIWNFDHPFARHLWLSTCSQETFRLLGTCGYQLSMLKKQNFYRKSGKLQEKSGLGVWVVCVGLERIGNTIVGIFLHIVINHWLKLVDEYLGIIISVTFC